jgi:RNA polymerase sigma-70 factor (ECF subfamily)
MTARDLANRLAAELGEPGRARDLEARFAALHLPVPDAGFIERLLAIATTVDALLALHLEDLAVAHHAAAGHPQALAQVRALLETLRAPLRRTGADAQQIAELLADLPGELVAPRAGGAKRRPPYNDPRAGRSSDPSSGFPTDPPGAAPRILGYAGSGPLGGWLRVVAVRSLVARRRTASPEDDDRAVAELAAPDDPELALLRQRYAVEFRSAFVAAVSALAPEDRLLLRQHHVDGVGIDRLALLHGCHRATAARRVAAARTSVFEAVRRRLLSELRIGGQTFDSLLRLVQSELDLSIHRYL